MGGSGGKSGAQKDKSMQIYQMQQADLARQKAALEAKEKAQRNEEANLRAELRNQMLGKRDILSSDDEDAVLQKNKLG